MLRSIVFGVLFYIATATLAVLGLPVLLGPRRWTLALLRLHARVSLALLRVIVGTRVEVRGLDRLPRGACLVAAKHQSAWDTFALVPLFADPAFVLKAELLRIPLYGWYCRKFGMIPVTRADGVSALRKLIATARSRTDEGRQVLIFPEGTRRPPGAPPAYKRGIVPLYEGLGVACVPVALNSGLYWPRRSWRRHPGTIIVEILPPIPPGLSRAALLARLEGDIETACDLLLREAAAGNPAPPLPDTAIARLAILAG